VVDLRYSTNFIYIFPTFSFVRFFEMQEGVQKNRMYFENNLGDSYGMPQPTFEYLPTENAALQAHDMMNECVARPIASLRCPDH
jgi:hypothetical protein